MNTRFNRTIDLFRLNYDDAESGSVREALKSKWISLGPRTQKFERKFAGYIGTKYGVGLNSCTAALHLALRILDIGPGDEVIVPSLTFVATANACLYVGARPVFADIVDLNDWTISPEDIRKKITPRTRAIIVMHYAGFGCRMDAIRAIAKRHNLKIVEDACHAPGGIWHGKRLGTLGDISCYSFYTNKNISTGEGGMLLTDDKGYCEKAKVLRSHGMTTSARDRAAGRKFYDIVELGYNYRLDDIHAALGLAQLKKLPRDIIKRNKIAQRYRAVLTGIDDVHIPFSGYEGLSTYYVFPILLKNRRDEVMKRLKKMGVQTSIHYLPVHLFRHFRKLKKPLPKTEIIGRRTLSLPMYGGMPDRDVDYVCECLKKAL